METCERGRSCRGRLRTGRRAGAPSACSTSRTFPVRVPRPGLGDGPRLVRHGHTLRIGLNRCQGDHGLALLLLGLLGLRSGSRGRPLLRLRLLLPTLRPIVGLRQLLLGLRQLGTQVGEALFQLLLLRAGLLGGALLLLRLARHGSPLDGGGLAGPIRTIPRCPGHPRGEARPTSSPGPGNGSKPSHPSASVWPVFTARSGIPRGARRRLGGGRRGYTPPPREPGSRTTRGESGLRSA